MFKKMLAVSALLLVLAWPLAAQESFSATAFDDLRSFVLAFFGEAEDAELEAAPDAIAPMIPVDGTTAVDQPGGTKNRNLLR